MQSSFTTTTLINTTTILNGSPVTLVDDYSYEIWDETQNWNCLLVSPNPNRTISTVVTMVASPGE